MRQDEQSSNILLRKRLKFGSLFCHSLSIWLSLKYGSDISYVNVFNIEWSYGVETC